MPKTNAEKIIEEFPDRFLGWMLEWAEKRISPAASPSAQPQSSDETAPGPAGQDSPSPDATGRSQKEGAVSGCIPSNYGDAGGACLTALVGFEAIRRDSVPTAPPAEIHIDTRQRGSASNSSLVLAQTLNSTPAIQGCHGSKQATADDGGEW